MKTTINAKWAGVAFAAIASIGLSPSAKAIIPLSYESGPTPPVGAPFPTPGEVQFKFSDYDTGSVYNPAAVPTAGFGAGGAAGSVTAGITALDALQVQGPTSPSMTQTYINNVAQGAGSTSNEDVWGIASVTSIKDNTGGAGQGQTIWSQLGKNDNLYVVISGEKDFYYTSSGGVTTTDGVGLRIDIYEKSGANTFLSSTGPAAGHGSAIYSTVDGSGSFYAGDTGGTFAAPGTPILSLRSVNGFINPDGVNGGLATEFESHLVQTLNGGIGSNGFAYMDIIGGTDAAQFEKGTIQSGLNPALFADLSIQFTETSFGLDPITGLPKTSNGWLVNSDDPVTATVIPEPGTVLAGLACLLPVFGAGYRRFKKLSDLIS